MKEGITSVDIEPTSNHVDFLGPTHDSTIAFETQTLKGNIRLVTTKAVKIKSINVKFKGESIIFQSKTQEQYQYEISTPILPKLKVKVYEKSTVLTQGEHLLPWELEIPNIYPMSFSNKKCNIKYKVQMKIHLGMNRTISASRVISIKRHLLPSQQQTSIQKIFEYTFANGFQYRIQVPKTVCIEQGHAPISVSFNGMPVEYISTQITQVEIYRCRHISKGEADVASNKKNGTISLFEQHKAGDSGLIKYIRPMQPVNKTTLDTQEQQKPIELLHSLEPTLCYDIESPLVAISHQLDVVFYFGPQHDEVRVKIPIIVTSVPDSKSLPNKTIEPLKKSVSDQGFQVLSISPPAYHKELPQLPSSLYQNTSKSDETISNTFMGLHPPPRRKKVSNLTLSRPSSPPIPNEPLTPLRRQFLNQSKSTTTSCTPTIIKRRSNSIDCPNIYSSSITNHYVSAELPPLPPPPPITRQRLPSVPNVDKSEHRKTRMYYDDESDEEESAYNLLFSE